MSNLKRKHWENTRQYFLLPRFFILKHYKLNILVSSWCISQMPEGQVECVAQAMLHIFLFHKKLMSRVASSVSREKHRKLAPGRCCCHFLDHLSVWAPCKTRYDGLTHSSCTHQCGEFPSIRKIDSGCPGKESNDSDRNGCIQIAGLYRGGGEGERGRYLTKFSAGMLCPEIKTPTLWYTTVGQKSTPLYT